ncbi:MAG: phosphomannomutase/phosphoglucomutase [Gemmatimonadota bacterium]
MKPSHHIFRQYDIRGILGVDLDSEVAHLVGQAYGSALRDQHAPSAQVTVAVGQDNRPSSPELADAVAQGLQAAGVSVISLGTVPTGTAYWAETALDTQGVMQITGSHNPPEWNGIKMTMGKRALYGDDIQDLLARIESNRMTRSGGGAREDIPVLARYQEDVLRRFSLPRKVKVVVDCGNGTASVVAVSLLESLGAEVIPLYCESDGTFPNHHPDPTVDENLEELMEVVRREGAEVGIAFDGDGDRIGAVDHEGTVVRGDVLLLLFGLDILKRDGEGQLLVFDVKCSQALPEAFEAAGGKTIMWKTGHSLIKEKMKETGAPIAGELSGHICFADDYLGIDDAIYAACRLVDLLARDSRSLKEMAAELPQYVSTPELRIEVAEELKVSLVEKAVAHFRDRYPVMDVDGVRILFGDGWGLLRSSNTQPVVVARFEARTPEALERIRGEVEGWLREQGVDV